MTKIDLKMGPRSPQGRPKTGPRGRKNDAVFVLIFDSFWACRPLTQSDLVFDLVIGWSQDGSKSVLGPLWGRLGGVLGGLGPLLGAAGPSLEGLGGLLGRLERLLGSFRTVLAAHDAINGSFWNATR